MRKYSVATNQWIPIRRTDGTVSQVGLEQAFLDAPEISTLAVAIAPACSALLRLMVVIAARITGLDHPGQPERWFDRRQRLWDEGRFDPDAVSEYFAKFADRFDLFNAKRPFLQDPRLDKECSKTSGVSKLDVSRSTGNNPIWIDHNNDAEPVAVSTERAAFHLLAWHFYGAAGRCTTRAIGDASSASMKAGPLRQSMSYHPLGATLFETLIAGIPRIDLSQHDGTPDLAPWETDELPDPLSAQPPPSGIARILTGRSRHAVLLYPSADGKTVVDCTVTWGSQVPQPPAIDPYLLHQLTKDGKDTTRRADADRAIWRDVDSLLRKTPGVSKDRPKRPPIFNDVEQLGPEITERLRVLALGCDQDPKTTNRQNVSATTPKIFAYLEENDETKLEQITSARMAGEQAGSRLHSALRNAWLEMAKANKGGIPWLPSAMVFYWSQAEATFWSILGDNDNTRIPNAFVQVALTAYAEATAPYSHRQHAAKIIAKHRASISSLWRTPIPTDAVTTGV